MVRGVYISSRNHSEKTTIANAFERYLKEITPTKKPTTQQRELGRVTLLINRLGIDPLSADKRRLKEKASKRRWFYHRLSHSVRAKAAYWKIKKAVLVQHH